MSEFRPIARNIKMTKSQVKKYIKDMEEKRLKAKLEIEKAKLNWELWDEDLDELENKIDNL